MSITFEIHTATAAMHGENVTNHPLGEWMTLGEARADLAAVRALQPWAEFKLVVLGATHLAVEGYIGLACCQSTDGPLTEGAARDDIADVTCPICLEVAAKMFGGMGETEESDAASPVVPGGRCQCEHVDHFSDEGRPAQAHEYVGVPAGSRRSPAVGLVCDECAEGHLAAFLVESVSPLAEIPAEISMEEAVRLMNEGARRVYCPRCERGHDGPCVILSASGRAEVEARGGDPLDEIPVVDEEADLVRADIAAERADHEGEEAAEHDAVDALREALDQPGEAVVTRYPVGTLYLAPNGDAYRLRGYGTDWINDPGGIPSVPDYGILYVAGGMGVNHELPAGSAVVWMPAPPVFVDPLGRIPGDVLILADRDDEHDGTGIGYAVGTEFLVREVRKGGSNGQAMYLVVPLHAPEAGEFLLNPERFERN